MNMDNHKILRIIEIIIASALLAFSCAEPLDRQVRQIIGEYQREYAPDSRTEVWNLSFSIENNTCILTGETTSQTGVRELIASLAEQLPRYEIHDSVTVLPDPFLGEKTAGIIRTGLAHVRRNPSHQAELITQVVLGSTVQLLKEEEGFFYCRLEDDYLGWLSKSSVHLGSDSIVHNWLKAPLGVYTRIYGTVHQEPDRSSYPVSDIVLSSRVRRMMAQHPWVKIQLPDGRTGFVLQEELMELEQFRSLTPEPERLVHMAKLMLGIPYLWGGTSTKGFDCSGFTQTLYKMNGVELPRDANMQVSIGAVVDTSDSFASLRAGDLLFFGSSSDQIAHVGMYLGDGRFIHESGMVKINSLIPGEQDYNAFRARTLRTVKRVF